jgi:low affinity Fe/Cu permease
MSQNKKNTFERFANWATRVTGSSIAFLLAASVVLVWALSGPVFGFSETWQLVINTGTTIVTFLMVFLIQKSQNKDSKAIHLKLNELIAAMEGASNRLVDVEDISEEEMDQLHMFYTRLASLAKTY